MKKSNKNQSLVLVKMASFIQLNTALFHAIGLFIKPRINTNSEFFWYSVLHLYPLDRSIINSVALHQTMVGYSLSIILVCVFSATYALLAVCQEKNNISLISLSSINILVFSFLFLITVLNGILLCWLFVSSITLFTLIYLRSTKTGKQGTPLGKKISVHQAIENNKINK